MSGNIIKKRLMSILFEKTPCINLSSSPILRIISGLLETLHSSDFQNIFQIIYAEKLITDFLFFATLPLAQ